MRQSTEHSVRAQAPSRPTKPNLDSNSNSNSRPNNSDPIGREHASVPVGSYGTPAPAPRTPTPAQAASGLAKTPHWQAADARAPTSDLRVVSVSVSASAPRSALRVRTRRDSEVRPRLRLADSDSDSDSDALAPTLALVLVCAGDTGYGITLVRASFLVSSAESQSLLSACFLGRSRYAHRLVNTLILHFFLYLARQGMS